MLDLFDTDKSSIDSISDAIIRDLEDIANTQGTNNKLIRLCSITASTKQCFIFNLDPFQKFGISKLPASAGKGEGIEWDVVFKFLSEGRGRELGKISDRLTEKQAFVVNEVLNGFKKTKPGVKGGSFLKIFPGSYKTFAVQLCSPWDEANFEPNSYAQVKYDGIRCVAAVDYDGNVSFLSRNGKPVENIAPWIEEAMSKFNGWVFDCETYSSKMHFQQNAGIAKRKNSDQKLVLKIFDFIPYDAFFEREYDVPYIDRYENLQNQLIGNDLEELIAEHTLVETVDDAIDFYEKARASGEEGAIVKKAHSLYSFDRNPDWQKVKPLETIECRVVELHEGTPDTKHVGRLGAMSVIDGTGAISRVGSGWSDVERQKIWNNPDDYIDTLCEVKFMERTVAGVFRHSRFKCWRHDKDELNAGL